MRYFPRMRCQALSRMPDKKEHHTKETKLKKISTTWITETDYGRYLVTQTGNSGISTVTETDTGKVLATLETLDKAKRYLNKRQKADAAQRKRFSWQPGDIEWEDSSPRPPRRMDGNVETDGR